MSFHSQVWFAHKRVCGKKSLAKVDNFLLHLLPPSPSPSSMSFSKLPTELKEWTTLIAKENDLVYRRQAKEVEKSLPELGEYDGCFGSSTLSLSSVSK